MSKRMRYMVLCVIVTLFSVADVAGQCCALHHTATTVEQDPFYKAKGFSLESQSTARNSDCSTPIVIPIAVHFSGSILDYGSAQDSMNIIAAIDEQISQLNADFGGYNSDIEKYCELVSNCSSFDPLALSRGTCIQFAIATQNHPNTTLTSAATSRSLQENDYAITFGKHAISDFNCTLNTSNNQYDCTLPLFTISNPEWSGYLNFYVSDSLPGGGPSVVFGAAPYLGGAQDPDGTGVFITADRFGGGNTPFDIGYTVLNSSGLSGRTATHEVGHFMGLPHIFQQDYIDTLIQGDCNIDSDGISDTPIQLYANRSYITFDIGDCGYHPQRWDDNRSSCNTDEEWFFNFMDYVRDDQMFMFSQGQSDLMYNTVINGGYNTGTIAANNVPTYAPLLSEPCTTEDDESFSYASCFNIVYTDYLYECGGNELTITLGKQFRYAGRDCESGTTVVNTGGGGGGFGGSGGGPGSPGGGGTGTATTSSNVPAVNVNEVCHECLNELIKQAGLIKSSQNGN